VFGVFFTDGAVTFCAESGLADDPSTEDMREIFGTLSSTVLVLFESISGGRNWGEVLNAMAMLQWEFSFFYLVFVTFAIFALVNATTAVFVEAAMQVSQNDREIVVMEEIEQKDHLIGMLQRIFEELDTDETGMLTLKEFEEHIDDERIEAFMNHLGLNVGQVRLLFALLDVDQSGEVNVEEFVSGCLKLKGGAKMLDLAILKYQVEWLVHHVMSLQPVHTTTTLGTVMAATLHPSSATVHNALPPSLPPPIMTTLPAAYSKVTP